MCRDDVEERHHERSGGGGDRNFVRTHLTALIHQSNAASPLKTGMETALAKPPLERGLGRCRLPNHDYPHSDVVFVILRNLILVEDLIFVVFCVLRREKKKRNCRWSRFRKEEEDDTAARVY